MAVENKVSLYGQVLKVIPERECITVMLMVIRRRNAGFGIINGANKLDVVPVKLRKKEQIQELLSGDMDFGINDMMYVYGVYCTPPKIKIWKCSECGELIKKPGNDSFVDALSYMVTSTPYSLGLPDGTQISRVQGLHMIQRMDEMSNRIKIMGNVVADPEYYVTSGGIPICTYNIAIDRNIHILEDPEEVRTDYPWVRSLGKVAESDHAHLKKGTLVYIDGSLHERKGFWRTLKCEFCGAEAKYLDRYGTMEIVPYEVEYLNNYIDPDNPDSALGNLDAGDPDDFGLLGDEE